LKLRNMFLLLLTVSTFGCIPSVWFMLADVSANINHTLGIHPKVETVNTEHSESLKIKNSFVVLFLLGEPPEFLEHCCCLYDL
jgi:hypothetical protein